MLRLLHEFFLLRRSQHDYNDYLHFIHAPGAITLDDDLIGYMWDTLCWIPTLNPAANEQTVGLNRYGTTVITNQGALQAQRVFGGWASLLSCGPAQLELRGPWTWSGESKDGDYEQLRFPRNGVVQSLRRLEADAASVAQGKGELYILHLGI